MSYCLLSVSLSVYGLGISKGKGKYRSVSDSTNGSEAYPSLYRLYRSILDIDSELCPSQHKLYIFVYFSHALEHCRPTSLTPDSVSACINLSGTEITFMPGLSCLASSPYSLPSAIISLIGYCCHWNRADCRFTEPVSQRQIYKKGNFRAALVLSLLYNLGTIF